MPDIEHVACDLTDEASTRAALARATLATHLFFVTWSRQPTEAENCGGAWGDVNGRHRVPSAAMNVDGGRRGIRAGSTSRGGRSAKAERPPRA